MGELRGQLHNMASANVSLILEVNRLKNIVKDLKEENGSLQTRDREHVRDHVTLILENSRLADQCKELASANAALEAKYADNLKKLEETEKEKESLAKIENERNNEL